MKNAPKVNREYTIPELKNLLRKAEERCAALESRVKVLTKQITSLGGAVPSDKDMEKLGLQMAA